MSNYRKIVSKIITESNSFWADSGLVEASYAPLYNFQNGKPVTVEAYHMTPYTFTKFRIGEVNAWGRGVYLTNKPENCSFNPETIKDWNKMRLLATFFKPFVYEDEIGDEFRNWLWSEIQNIVNENTMRNNEKIADSKYSFESSYMDVYYRLLFKNAMGTSFKKQSSLNVMNSIQHYDNLFNLDVYSKLGLDGMILPFGKTGMMDENNKDTVWYVCYKPNQIKSYEGNNGNYSLESDDINENVELTERILPEIPDDKYADLLKDTSQTGKANAYTKFFGEYLLKNRLHKDEDISNLTKRHNALYQAGLVKPITDYTNIFELIHDLDSKRDYKTNSQKDKESKAKAKIIGNIDGFNLYEITSYDASKKYGAGTKWCTTSEIDRSYYDSHKTEKLSDNGWKKLIYAIDEKDKKYAITISRMVSEGFISCDIGIYNSEDKFVANYMVQGVKRYDPKTNKPYIDYDKMFNWDIIHDDSNEKLLRDFLQWGIEKYNLSREELEKEYYKKFSTVN